MAASAFSRSLTERAATLLARCDLLARHSDEPGCITRSYGAPALAAARHDISLWMQTAGMRVRSDAIGNLRGRYDGTHPAKPALLLGSHIDSVRDAGRYDGMLGVLTALAVIEQLAASGKRLPFPVEIVAFPDEEGLRFQTTYLGSCALAGTFDSGLLERIDKDGNTLRDVIATFGGDPDGLAAAELSPGDAFAYVEVHIEQGPFLESVDVPVGVVTAISGQTRVVVTFIGEAGHAGTVTMALRHDPLPAAAELVLAAEHLARETPGLLATVGRIEASPGATNVIPGQVELTLDIRYPDDANRQAALASLERQASEIALARGIEREWQVMRDHPAVACDTALTERLAVAVTAAGLPVIRLPSGAGHDAVVMATRLPVAMLFVRCARGISHNPAESVSAGDVAAAIDTLDRLLDSLAESGP